MFFSRWLRNRMSRGFTTRQRHRARPALEPLEDRLCPSYTAIDLGSLTPNALNEAGQVVGQATVANGEEHAFLWQDGTTTDLGTAGLGWSAANDINDHGQVVGNVGFAGGYSGEDAGPPSPIAALWQDGVTTVLGDLYGVAYAINNAGQIVGYDGGVYDGGGPCVWENGIKYYLNDLMPTGASLLMDTAYEINDAGQIVGWGFSGAEIHAFLYSDDDGTFANGGAVLTDLGTLGGDTSDAQGLNNAGQVVGWSNTASFVTSNHAFLYRDGAMTDLDTLGSDYSSAEAINDAGQAVGEGYVFITDTQSAFLWRDGQMTYLDSLLDPSSEWILSGATDINERGEIVGSGWGAGRAAGFLLIESSLPTLSIGNIAVTEGDVGTAIASFTVTLSAASDQPVTVTYATSDINAVAGSDYEAASGTLTFAPGETSKDIDILVQGDRRDEPDQFFLVGLSSATNAVITNGTGLGTILDDDAPPSLTIGDLTHVEGSSGSTSFVFTATLSAVSDQFVSVYFVTANGSATAGSDYQAARGTLTFAPGETTQTITVQVTGDTRDELDETFAVNLSSPTNATLSDGQAVGTILDDDPPPSLRITDVTRAEGNSSGTTAFVFTVSLSAPSDRTVTVNFATADGTARVNENDYLATSGTLTFAPGQTSKTITVLVKGDKKKEANETFFVNLSTALNAVIADGQGLGTILNDDP